jgi:N-methylhydantoinase A
MGGCGVQSARAAESIRRGAVIVGVDTGGTFTDLVVLSGGATLTHKVLSTPARPEVAVLRGLRELLPDQLPCLVTYGTTVATNALLERRGARVVLLTTRGFEDVIEIGRQQRPDLYALEPTRAEPLVARRHRIGVTERTLHDGRIDQPLRPRAVQAAVRAALRCRPDAVAVCLLHAYANPRHERALAGALRAAAPVFCSLSHALVSEYREYERCSTTVVNAYVGPVMRRHVRALERGRRGMRLRVLQSNGGAISARRASDEAVRTVLSGPAGGVMGAWAVARALGLSRVITFDMGGTSTDVSLIDRQVQYRTESDIGGLPVKVPAIDIHTVGAGGGSIARLDAGGALKVGPQSAGADPGPACYGRGDLPTVTDANVVLGRLAAEAFLGGRMHLDTGRARRAVGRLAEALYADCETAAEGILRVINASMERAIRRVSVERGHDPREYSLIAFGGAAGQHACALAEALGIRQVVVPGHPGLLSAWGAALADVQRDYVRTVRLRNPSVRALHSLLRPLEQAARRALEREGIPARRQAILRSLDVSYEGQSHEISVPYGPAYRAAFHAAHQRLYGYADPGRAVVVVNVRVLGRGGGVKQVRRRAAARSSVRRTRHVLHWGGRPVNVPLVWRTSLAAGTDLRGPAVLAEFSATTVVAPRWHALVHRGGHVVLTHAG